MIQFYPFLCGSGGLGVQKQRESDAIYPMHGPGKSLTRSSFPFPILGFLSVVS